MGGCLPLRRDRSRAQIVRTTDAPSSPTYSQAVKVDGTIRVSGTVGIDVKTSRIAGASIQEQTHQAIVNCRSILAAAGATLGDVVSVPVLLATLADFAGMNEEYAKFFARHPPTSAVTRLGVELPNVLFQS